MMGMTYIDQPRETNGEFGSKPDHAAELTIGSVPEMLGYPATCTEGCGRPPVYRSGNIPNGYRAPQSESAWCEVHAAEMAADGGSIERFPEPQAPGEVLVWLIEGDDHEFVKVEAASEDEALERAAEQFEDRYDEGDEDEDEGGGDHDIIDSLRVAGAFRGDVDGYSDELDFVPLPGVVENDAYHALQYS